MIAVMGAGAFGTALAVALAASGRDLRLWTRSEDRAKEMQASRQNVSRLPGVVLPENVTVLAESAAVSRSEAVLLCVPMQSLSGLLSDVAEIGVAQPVVACCKGLDLHSLRGPASLILAARPEARVAMLTGPSFAADIAQGLPTALTLACDDSLGIHLQNLLSGPTLRLYRTDDVIGAELGGALKNVIAIAAGVVIGAGLGQSARAALMTRGYAEMLRVASHLGARPETLAGLSGLGDLVLTCTSDKSRNFRYGEALGRKLPFDPNVTVEGVATALAVVRLAARLGLDLPVTKMVDALARDAISLEDAIQALMSRPLKQE